MRIPIGCEGYVLLECRALGTRSTEAFLDRSANRLVTSEAGKILSARLSMVNSTAGGQKFLEGGNT